MKYIHYKNNLHDPIFNIIIDKTMIKLDKQIRNNKQNTLIEMIAFDLFRRMANNSAYLD